MAYKNKHKADPIARAAEIPIDFFEKQRNELENIVTKFLRVGDTIKGDWVSYRWSEGILTLTEFTLNNTGRNVIDLESQSIM